MVLSSIHSQALPPSGASHAVALHLIPQSNARRSTSSSSKVLLDGHAHRGVLISHLVTARDDILNVYEIRRSSSSTSSASYDIHIYLLRSHTLFGKVSGLSKCTIGSANLESQQQGMGADATSVSSRDTLVVTFLDAKMALMQWSEIEADLTTISIHTYERAPQLAEGLPHNFLPTLSLDPDSRCASLLLPDDTLAVLPFYSDTAAELDELLELAEREGHAVSLQNQLPYAPSFLLPLADADAEVKNVRDMVFLPSFQRPTIAVLFEKEATWTGRLSEHLDSCSVHFITLDLTISSSAHSVISTKDSLPYDCLYIQACPSNIGGGVFVVTSSAIFHLDQDGRVVGLAVNGWHEQTSKLSLPRWGLVKAEMNGSAGGHDARDGQQLDLCNSHLMFPSPGKASSAFLFLQDGSIYSVSCQMEGRSMASLGMEKKAESVQPSLAIAVPSSDFLFVGSMVGSSEVLRARQVERIVEEEDLKPFDDAVDMDLDVDLYGDDPAAPSTSDGTSHRGKTKTRMEWEITSVSLLPSFGPIHSLAPIVSGKESVEGDGGIPQTVACTGAGRKGGLTFFEPRIVPIRRRQLPLTGSSGVWSIRWDGSRKQSLLLVSHERRSELCWVVEDDGTIATSLHLDGRTLAASPLTTSGGEPALLRATSNGVEIIKESGEVIDASMMDSSRKGKDKAKASGNAVYQATIHATFVSLLHADGSLQIGHYDADRGKMEQVQLDTTLQEARFLSASIFEDKLGTFKYQSDSETVAASQGVEASTKSPALGQRRMQIDDEEEIDYGDDVDEQPGYQSSDAQQNGADVEDGEQPSDRLWMALVSSQGILQLVRLPDLHCAWTSGSLYSAPTRLDFSQKLQQTGSMDISHVLLSYIGDLLHVVVAFDNGLLNVYEANGVLGDDEETKKATSSYDKEILELSFVKVLARHLDPTGLSILRPPNGEALAGAGTSLSQFAYPTPFGAQDAVFVGGSNAGWLFKSQYGPVHFFDCAVAPVDTCASLDPSEGVDGRASLAYTQYGMVGIASLPYFDFTLPVPHRTVPLGRTFTLATPHPFTKTILTASQVEQDFTLFDPESGQAVEDPMLDPTQAKTMRGALELFADGSDEPVDGYELEQCEVACSVELVTLRSASTPSGLKDYLAVGTMVSHGEDRPSKGATYIFDIVEVVPDPEDYVARFKLKLIVKDEAKGPITAIADMNGYLVVVMGLKLFVRSLENDEWLVTIAFLDTPFHCTSLRRLKNFLLLTDVRRSVWFIAFQEEPYRLVVVAKDHNEVYATRGDFLLREDQFAIVTTSLEGVLRILDYAPSIPATHGGQKLLLRTEYQMSNEVTASTIVAGEAAPDGMGLSTLSELVYGLRNGAIETLVTVEEDVAKRLQVLQGQMVRNIQHTAGLNPRGYRTVRNDFVSRALTKGVLDGMLLEAFVSLPKAKMDDLVSTIPDLKGGADQILRDIASLRSHWGMI